MDFCDYQSLSISDARYSRITWSRFFSAPESGAAWPLGFGGTSKGAFVGDAASGGAIAGDAASGPGAAGAAADVVTGAGEGWAAVEGDSGWILGNRAPSATRLPVRMALIMVLCCRSRRSRNFDMKPSVPSNWA